MAFFGFACWYCFNRFVWFSSGVDICLPDIKFPFFITSGTSTIVQFHGTLQFHFQFSIIGYKFSFNFVAFYSEDVNARNSSENNQNFTEPERTYSTAYPARFTCDFSRIYVAGTVSCSALRVRSAPDALHSDSVSFDPNMALDAFLHAHFAKGPHSLLC